MVTAKLAVLLVVAALSGCGPHVVTVPVKGRLLRLEVVDTPQAMARGLGGRDRMAHYDGMLFQWRVYHRPQMWMRGMRFPLDVLFLRDGLLELAYPQRVPCPPGGDCPTFGPTVSLVNQVVELNAGLYAELGLKPGDKLDIPSP